MRNIQTSSLSALHCAFAVLETEDGTAVERDLEASDSDGGRAGLNAMDGHNQRYRIVENPEVNWNQLPLCVQPLVRSAGRRGTG